MRGLKSVSGQLLVGITN